MTKRIKLNGVYQSKSDNSEVIITGKTRNSVCVKDKEEKSIDLNKNKWYTIEDFNKKYKS